MNPFIFYFLYPCYCLFNLFNCKTKPRFLKSKQKKKVTHILEKPIELKEISKRKVECDRYAAIFFSTSFSIVMKTHPLFPWGLDRAEPPNPLPRGIACDLEQIRETVSPVTSFRLFLGIMSVPSRAAQASGSLGGGDKGPL